MLIYLLRHGQTEYNAQKRYQGQRDIPLSAAGIAQLRQADFAPEVHFFPRSAECFAPHRRFVQLDFARHRRRGWTAPPPLAFQYHPAKVPK